jgi:O-antigen/teichoic acid export membrane protein
MFGDAFSDAGKVLPYLAVSSYLALLNLTVSSQVLGMNRVDLYLKWIYVDLIVCIVLLLIFVPSNVLGIHTLGMSYQGAAIASIILAFVGFGIARWLTYSLTGAQPNPAILKHIAAAAGIGIIMFYAGTVIPVTHWFEAAAYLLISLGGFLGILYCLREFSAHDFRFFLDTMNLRKLKHYVTAELSHKKRE